MTDYYVFYRELAALNANKNRTLDEVLLQGKAFAVGDAKYWEHPLDQKLKRALFQSAAQIPDFPKRGRTNIQYFNPEFRSAAQIPDFPK